MRHFGTHKLIENAQELALSIIEQVTMTAYKLGIHHHQINYSIARPFMPPQLAAQRSEK